jgi:hypothetical protein
MMLQILPRFGQSSGAHYIQKKDAHLLNKNFDQSL